MKTALSLVWECVLTRSDFIRALAGRHVPKAPHVSAQFLAKDVKNVLLASERTDGRTPLVVFCALIRQGDSIEGADLSRFTKVVERGCEYVAVATDGITQEAYHRWVDRIHQMHPQLKFFDPNIGGKALEEIVERLDV